VIDIFIKNKELKLSFGDRVVILNDFFCGYGESTIILHPSQIISHSMNLEDLKRLKFDQIYIV